MALNGAEKTMRNEDDRRGHATHSEGSTAQLAGVFTAAGMMGRSLLLASTVLGGMLGMPATAAFAQAGGATAPATEPSAIRLDRIAVEGEGARGAGTSIVPTRSAGASKTDTPSSSLRRRSAS